MSCNSGRRNSTLRRILQVITQMVAGFNLFLGVKFYFSFAPPSFAWISDFAHRAVVVRNKRDGKPSPARSTRACTPTPCVRVQGHGRPQNSIFSLICQAVTAKRNSRSLFRAARLAPAALANQADSFVSLFTTNP